MNHAGFQLRGTTPASWRYRPNKTGKVPSPDVGPLFFFGWIRALRGNSRRDLVHAIQLHFNRHRHRLFRPPLLFGRESPGLHFGSPNTFRHLGDWGASLLLSSFKTLPLLTQREMLICLPFSLFPFFLLLAITPPGSIVIN